MDERISELLTWAASDDTPPVLDLPAIEARARVLRRRQVASRVILGIPLALVALVLVGTLNGPQLEVSSDSPAPVISILGTVQLAEEEYLAGRLGGFWFDGETVRVSVVHDGQQYGAALSQSGRHLCIFRYDQWLDLGASSCVEAAEFGSEDFMIRRYRSDPDAVRPWAQLSFVVGDGITQVSVDSELIPVRNNMVVIDDHLGIEEAVLIGPAGSKTVVLPDYPEAGRTSELNSR